jgi:hypothetical protein
MSMPSLEIILQSTADVMQALKGQRSFEDVFGLNEFDLRKEFLLGYGKSSSSLKTLGVDTRNTPTESGGRLVTNDSAEPLELPIYFSLGVNEVYRINENVINKEALEKGVVKLGGKSSVTYDRVKEEGSFTQNPMGFVFGPRPLFEELVPSLVENEVTAVKETPSKLQQALSQDKQIVATEDTIEISQKVNPTDDPFNGNYEVLEEIQSTQQTSLEFGGNTLVDPADYDSSSEASKQSDDNSVSLKLTKFHSEELLLEASRLNEIRNERGLDVDTPEKLIEEYNKLNKVTGGAYSADQFIDMIKQCYI